MAVAAKKTAVRTKAPAAALPVLQFEAEQSKTTPGAFQFKETAASRDEEVSGGLYVRKAPLGSVKPKRIRVTVEVLEVEA